MLRFFNLIAAGFGVGLAYYFAFSTDPAQHIEGALWACVAAIDFAIFLKTDD